VELVPAEETASHAEELRTILLDRLLSGEGAEPELASAGLRELVERAERDARLRTAEDAKRATVFACSRVPL
jgi:hypothetical protein